MTMILHSPVEITSRLLPGVQIGKDWLSIQPTGREKSGRVQWRMFLDFADGEEYECDDLTTFRHDTQRALTDCLAFMSACGEGYGYQLRSGRESENASLFPPHVAEWCHQHADELAMLCCELEETAGLIEEGQ